MFRASRLARPTNPVEKIWWGPRRCPRLQGVWPACTTRQRSSASGCSPRPIRSQILFPPPVGNVNTPREPDIRMRSLAHEIAKNLRGYAQLRHRLKGFNVIDSHGSVAEIGRTQTFEWDTGWFRWTHCALIAEVASATSRNF